MVVNFQSAVIANQLPPLPEGEGWGEGDSLKHLNRQFGAEAVERQDRT